MVNSPTVPSDFIPPRIDGLSITDWQLSTEPKLNGVKLALEANEKSQALAVRPDKTGFVLGTFWYIRAYDSNGEQLWARPTSGDGFGR